MSDIFSELTSAAEASLSDAERQDLARLDFMNIQRANARTLIDQGIVARAIMHADNPPQSPNPHIYVYRKQHQPVIRDGRAITAFLEIGGVRFINEMDESDVIDIDVYRRRGSEDAPVITIGRFLPEEGQLVADMAAELAFRSSMGDFQLRPDLTALLEPQASADGQA